MNPKDSFLTTIPKLRLFVQTRTKNNDLTDDVVQETMLRTFRSREIDNLQNPLAYMVTVSKTVLFDHWKSKLKAEADFQLDTLEDKSAGIEEAYLQQEKIHILRNVLANMPELRRKVFEMRRIDGKSREVIAKELGISVEAVKKHINRAMVELTSCAEKHDWNF
ncbi:MAG: RNA polymerase sigma factor [Paraglaciecola sp.]|uniref:RNA polymerase sigma factor n=1 Tax=Paraglaciecola sp. TaxID=1920173 RepID=UPI003297EAFE